MSSWVRVTTRDGQYRLTDELLLFGGKRVQQMFHEMYGSDAKLDCMCNPDRPVPMHLRRLRIRPPSYCLVTYPKYRHSSDCARYHSYRIQPPLRLQSGARKGQVNEEEQRHTAIQWNASDGQRRALPTAEKRRAYVPSLEQLNDAQREAAMHRDGPCIVVAAAGSGKTAMLIARIKHLMDSGVTPERILACTFTKKAAHEMRDRLLEASNDGRGKAVTIGTIHSVAYRMVIPELHGEWKVIPEPAWLVEQVLERPSGYNMHGVGRIMELPDAILGIYNAKADGLWPEHVVDERLSKVYAAYEALKAEKKQLDFEDLLMHAIRRFQNSPDFAKKWRNRWDYVLVDEFQDTNVAQWQFLLELVKDSQNLFVIGDDYQSIYAFRGARPALMGEFTRQFPSAKRVFLTINYRSHDLIVDLGNRVIQLNRGHQINKRVSAHRTVTEHSIAQVVTVATDFEEARFVASEIAQLRERDPNTPLNEYAVLYRTNIQSRLYEEALAQLDIPYQVVGDSHFYEHRDVKAILDYLRVSLDTTDPALWGPLMNRPKRFIPSSVVKEVQHAGWEAVTQHPKCRSFVETIEALRQHRAPTDAIQWLVQTQTGLIQQQDDDEPIRWVDSVVAAAARHATVPEFLRYVDWILERSKKPQDDAVQLLTIHRSKGLEYNTVFVVGLAEGLLPYKKSVTKEAMREETRLCYVAITRAKDNLYLLSAMTYGKKEREVSRFIRALKE